MILIALERSVQSTRSSELSILDFTVAGIEQLARENIYRAGHKREKGKMRQTRSEGGEALWRDRRKVEKGYGGTDGATDRARCY